jgi:hypothetical protein
MSLQEALAELRQQLDEQQKLEQEAASTETEEKEIEAVEEKQEEPKEEEKSEPEPEKKQEEPEDKQENAAFARMRREAAAAQKKAADEEIKRLELEKIIKEIENNSNAVEPASEAPAIPEELIEMVKEHKLSKAEKEFKELENKFRATAPDYDAVTAEYAMALAQAIKIQNPRLSNEQVALKAKEEILIKASNFLSNGYDPIGELYHQAKELGFNGNSIKKAAEQKEKEVVIKPDLEKLAANRARSSGMTGAGGTKEGVLTAQRLSEMSAGEYAKVPLAEKIRLGVVTA